MGPVIVETLQADVCDLLCQHPGCWEATRSSLRRLISILLTHSDDLPGMDSLGSVVNDADTYNRTQTLTDELCSSPGVDLSPTGSTTTVIPAYGSLPTLKVYNMLADYGEDPHDKYSSNTCLQEGRYSQVTSRTPNQLKEFPVAPSVTPRSLTPPISTVKLTHKLDDVQKSAAPRLNVFSLDQQLPLKHLPGGKTQAKMIWFSSKRMHPLPDTRQKAILSRREGLPIVVPRDVTNDILPLSQYQPPMSPTFNRSLSRVLSGTNPYFSRPPTRTIQVHEDIFNELVRLPRELLNLVVQQCNYSDFFSKEKMQHILHRMLVTVPRQQRELSDLSSACLSQKRIELLDTSEKHRPQPYMYNYPSTQQYRITSGKRDPTVPSNPPSTPENVVSNIHDELAHTTTHGRYSVNVKSPVHYPSVASSKKQPLSPTMKKDIYDTTDILTSPDGGRKKLHYEAPRGKSGRRKPLKFNKKTKPTKISFQNLPPVNTTGLSTSSAASTVKPFRYYRWNSDDFTMGPVPTPPRVSSACLSSKHPSITSDTDIQSSLHVTIPTALWPDRSSLSATPDNRISDNSDVISAPSSPWNPPIMSTPDHMTRHRGEGSGEGDMRLDTQSPPMLRAPINSPIPDDMPPVEQTDDDHVYNDTTTTDSTVPVTINIPADDKQQQQQDEVGSTNRRRSSLSERTMYQLLPGSPSPAPSLTCGPPNNLSTPSIPCADPDLIAPSHEMKTIYVNLKAIDCSPTPPDLSVTPDCWSQLVDEYPIIPSTPSTAQQQTSSVWPSDDTHISKHPTHSQITDIINSDQQLHTSNRISSPKIINIQLKSKLTPSPHPAPTTTTSVSSESDIETNAVRYTVDTPRGAPNRHPPLMRLSGPRHNLTLLEESCKHRPNNNNNQRHT